MWGKGFVRGSSSDEHVKGERYDMKPTMPFNPMQARKRSAVDDDDAYFDEPDEPAAGSSAIDDDPLDAYMAQLEGRAVVIHDSSGRRIACALLKQVTAAQPATAEGFSKY